MGSSHIHHTHFGILVDVMKFVDCCKILPAVIDSSPSWGNWGTEWLIPYSGICHDVIRLIIVEFWVTRVGEPSCTQKNNRQQGNISSRNTQMVMEFVHMSNNLDAKNHQTCDSWRFHYQLVLLHNRQTDTLIHYLNNKCRMSSLT